MSDFGDAARQFARRLSYTEYEAEEITLSRAQKAGDAVEENLEEPRVDELCSLLDVNTEHLETTAVAFSPRDVALAAWSNWGAGSWERAHPKSSLSADEFVVLNDSFDKLVALSDD